MTKANFTYYISEGILVGTANNTPFYISALSGGGGMSSKGITDSSVVNNPYMTGKKTSYEGKNNATSENRGGPIPLGRYRIAPPTLGYGYKYARLLPFGQTVRTLHGIKRDGFLIHSRGKLGSDGCIVPVSFDSLKSLMDALEVSQGGMLFVVESMNEGAFA
jgi:hypothetical protein